MAEAASFRVGCADDGFHVIVTVYRTEPGADSRHAQVFSEPVGDLNVVIADGLANIFAECVTLLEAGEGTRYDAPWLASRLADFCDFVQANPLDPRRGYVVDRREAEGPGLPAPADLQGEG